MLRIKMPRFLAAQRRALSAQTKNFDSLIGAAPRSGNALQGSKDSST